MKIDWLTLVLLVTGVLLLTCNIALWRRYQWERQQRISWEKKDQDKRTLLQSLGMQEIGRWQAEIVTHRHLDQAVESLRLEKYDAVVKSVDEAVAGDPENPLAYYLRGIARQALQQDESALEDFTRYLHYVPVSVYALWHRAQIYAGQKRIQEARENLQEALGYQPDFTPAQSLLKHLAQ